MALFLMLSGLALVSMLATIRADYAGQHQQVYIFKPLTMVFIIALALTEDSTISDTYKTLILVGLTFSVMGDVWLMLPQDYFVRGLVSFLIAHMAYIVAFSLTDDHLAPLWWALPLLILSGGIFVYLRPGLGKYTAPVVVYMLVITLMGFQALNRWQASEDWGGVAALLGALLFMLSDSVLAVNRFRQPFAWAQAVILGTYVVAQWLIAQSI